MKAHHQPIPAAWQSLSRRGRTFSTRANLLERYANIVSDPALVSAKEQKPKECPSGELLEVSGHTEDVLQQQRATFPHQRQSILRAKELPAVDKTKLVMAEAPAEAGI